MATLQVLKQYMMFGDPPEEQQNNNLSNSTLRRKLFNGDILRQAIHTYPVLSNGYFQSDGFGRAKRLCAARIRLFYY
jgi:hypothetical protein